MAKKTDLSHKIQGKPLIQIVNYPWFGYSVVYIQIFFGESDSYLFINNELEKGIKLIELLLNIRKKLLVEDLSDIKSYNYNSGFDYFGGYSIKFINNNINLSYAEPIDSISESEHIPVEKIPC